MSPFLSKLLAAALVLLPLADAQAQTVRLKTSMGDVRIQLQAEKAPKSVANFLAYVKAGHYDGTIFHRVIADFMIQGGGFTQHMVQKPVKAPIPLEASNGLSNTRGTVAMARTPDPNSATAQFFVNVVDNVFLDAANARDGHGYAVFGQVIEGMEVIDQIRAVPVENKGMHANVPVQPVLILKASIEKESKP
ncbi:MAG: peptidyl-prolyl cis-trans isomerase [Burkholderiales bacterium]|uniref:peptidylprolyl isomerase n=1 Tax=Inhella sp. TaxID=1921806 RepID=UPI001ACDE465|nr:peptidyl-prolyl cis-trans isomerase [Burkholderiales bacterium]